MQATDKWAELTTEEMILEIRQLLHPNQTQEKELLNLSNSEIDRMLFQSLQQTNKKQQPPMKLQTRHKIIEASNYLSQENELIKGYTRQKIQAEIFSSRRGNLSNKERKYVEEQRNELIKIREQEKKEKVERENKIIQNAKKFKKYQTQTLFYHQINGLIQSQNNTAQLLKHKEELSAYSHNNQVRAESPQNLELSYRMQVQTMEKQPPQSPKSFISVNVDDDQQGDKQMMIEVEDYDEMNEDAFRKRSENTLQEILCRKDKLILRIMIYLLEKQVKLESYLRSNRIGMVRNSINRSDYGFKYSNRPIPYFSIKEKTDTLASLTRLYKTKGILIVPKLATPRHHENSMICQKVVSKMIGESHSFHPKKVQLFQNQLHYYDESDTQEKDGKVMNLVLQKIQVVKTIKQQGSFFMKSTADIDLVLVKGQQRNWKFQRDMLQGKQIYQQLCKLMAIKVYDVNVLISCNYNQNLYKFITSEKATVFDLSDSFIQPHEKYPLREYRGMTLDILRSIFPQRTRVTEINMANCRLNCAELTTMAEHFCHFKKLKKIVISQTKINVAAMNSILDSLVDSESGGIVLCLPDCCIEDKILINCKDSFRNVSHLIEELDVSSNEFTFLGLDQIAEYLHEENCAITHLTVNNCQIISLIKLGQLIMSAKKLRVINAQNCGFTFNDQLEIQRFFLYCKSSKIEKISLLGNEVVADMPMLDKFWTNQSPREIDLHIGMFSGATAKNLQARLIE